MVNFFNQPVKKNMRTYGNLRKTTKKWFEKKGQGNDYVTGSILDYLYFKKIIS